jgi:putative CRISPR-associated protein (TIGR02619 family)
MSRPILLCTVGTSLLNARSAGGKHTTWPDGPDGEPVCDWPAIAAELAKLAPTERPAGAESNSIASLVKHEYAPANAGIYLFHSDTTAGRGIAAVLADYFTARGHAPVTPVAVADLQDVDPKRFRTHGLRNLAKRMSEVVQNHGAPACAINATGGYKAQVAIAVLLGQALRIPVYYMHERFSEIISFPPMPVAFDFEMWMRASGVLAALDREPQPRSAFAEEWDERYESLVQGTDITGDGTEHLELSATGQIFHEMFKDRFRTDRDKVLPAPARPSEKRSPKLGDHGVISRLRAELTRHLQAATDGVPAVVGCETTYCNPDLPEPTRFRLKGEEVEGIYTDGTATVKFRVDTTAQTSGQRAAVVAALNEWLASRK